MNPQVLFGTGVSSAKDANDLHDLVRECIIDGIWGFDTAPSYHTERLLGVSLNRCIEEKILDRESIFIQTKIDGWQMQDGKIEEHARFALKEMDLEYFDALLIHWPFPEYLEDCWNKLIRLKELGMASRIGICNLRHRNIEELISKGIVPEIIQIERNPINTMEKEVQLSLDQSIWVQAYSPLCKMNTRIKDNSLLSEIAEKHKKNIGQIVMRWQIDTGVSPIFTSKKKNRIKEYAQVFDFHLSLEEKIAISSLNQNYKLYLESFQCPGS